MIGVVDHRAGMNDHIWTDKSKNSHFCDGPENILIIRMNFFGSLTIPEIRIIEFTFEGGKPRIKSMGLANVMDNLSSVLESKTSLENGLLTLQKGKFLGELFFTLNGEYNKFGEDLSTLRSILKTTSYPYSVQVKLVQETFSHLNITLVHTMFLKIYSGKNCGTVSTVRHSYDAELKNWFSHFEKLGDMENSILFPRKSEGEKSDLSSLVSPFWSLSWLVLGILTWLSIWVHVMVLKRGWGWALWAVLAPFIFQIPDQKKRTITISFWILSTFLLTNFYLAELTSNGISPSVLKTEAVFEDIKREGLEFALFATPTFQFIEESSRDDICIMNALSQDVRKWKMDGPWDWICDHWFNWGRRVDQRKNLNHEDHIALVMHDFLSPTYELAFNIQADRTTSWHIMEEDLYIDSIFMMISPPNLKLLRTSVQRTVSSGITGFWWKVENGITIIEYLGLMDITGIPQVPSLWKGMMAEHKERLERERVQSLKNSLLVTAFILLLVGVSLGLLSFGA